MSTSGNGGDTSKLENVMRFMGLASRQQRGQSAKEPSGPRQPTQEEIRNLALTEWLQNRRGSDLLMELLEVRIQEAIDGAQVNVTTHALCAGFLGAQAALQRLHNDLHRLRG